MVILIILQNVGKYKSQTSKSLNYSLKIYIPKLKQFNYNFYSYRILWQNLFCNCFNLPEAIIQTTIIKFIILVYLNIFTNFEAILVALFPHRLYCYEAGNASYLRDNFIKLLVRRSQVRVIIRSTRDVSTNFNRLL